MELVEPERTARTYALLRTCLVTHRHSRFFAKDARKYLEIGNAARKIQVLHKSLQASEGEIMAPPTISVGSKGPAVEKAQQALLDRGYPIGPAGVDGIFGPHTRNAVMNYQADRSAGQYWAFSYPLDVDGIIGPQTWGRLAPETIRRGDKGTGVRLAQNILKYFGVPDWDPGLVDAIFGPQTELAVTNFQRDMTLKADGIVGPVTWTALWS